MRHYLRYWMYMGPPIAISSAHQLMAVKPYQAGRVQRHHASTVVSAFLTVLRGSHRLQGSRDGCIDGEWVSMLREIATNAVKNAMPIPRRPRTLKDEDRARNRLRRLKAICSSSLSH